jgi:hypothetical protein
MTIVTVLLFTAANLYVAEKANNPWASNSQSFTGHVRQNDVELLLTTGMLFLLQSILSLTAKDLFISRY